MPRAKDERLSNQFTISLFKEDYEILERMTVNSGFTKTLVIRAAVHQALKKSRRLVDYLIIDSEATKK